VRPNGLEMNRPAGSSIGAQTRFAAAGRVGSIELFGGGHAAALFPFVRARAPPTRRSSLIEAASASRKWLH